MGFKDTVKKNQEISELIAASGRSLEAMRYNEHGFRHALYVGNTTERILKKLGYSIEVCELGFIAGYMHDTGNSINRVNHGHMSAMFAYDILKSLGMPFRDINTVTAAIGNHEEQTGVPINEVGAALIIADKSDAHKTRVSRPYNAMEIHSRVNLAIKKNVVDVLPDKRTISSKIYMASSISSVMEYFEIYLSRITMSEKAAKLLGCVFKLYINNVLINSPKEVDLDGSEKDLKREGPEREDY